MHSPIRRQQLSTPTIRSSLLLRARLVLPVSQPPIPNGAVVVSGGRFVAASRWRDLSARKPKTIVDLGDVVLMPGLVNAHCHLDYTNMAGQFPPPDVFSDWLKLITETKAGWSRADYLESWLKGADMLLRTGTTTVADIEAVPELLPEAWRATPLRVFSFLELIGIRGQRRPQDIVQEAVDRLIKLKPLRGGVGLCPHAPYSTVPELMRLSARTAQQRRWPLTTHVAESSLEYAMFARARGGMFDWLQRGGRDMSDCGMGSPVQYLERCGVLSKRLLATHANYLCKRDPTLLARRDVHVVHCPRSHFYFQHDRLPLRRLLKAGVNLCLGTDSLASVYKTRRQPVELSLFEEMRALAKAAPWLSARKIVRMATVNGARALGLQGRIGEITPGAFADLIAIPFTGKVANVYSAVLSHPGNVAASMIEGRWAFGP
jgi:aminodeoxyfutalosine deaminase